MDGTEGPRAELYRAFAALVEERAGMPVRARRTCPGCGAEVGTGARFCADCGAKLSCRTGVAVSDAAGLLVGYTTEGQVPLQNQGRRHRVHVLFVGLLPLPGGVAGPAPQQEDG